MQLYPSVSSASGTHVAPLRHPWLAHGSGATDKQKIKLNLSPVKPGTQVRLYPSGTLVSGTHVAPLRHPWLAHGSGVKDKHKI